MADEQPIRWDHTFWSSAWRDTFRYIGEIILRRNSVPLAPAENFPVQAETESYTYRKDMLGKPVMRVYGKVTYRYPSVHVMANHLKEESRVVTADPPWALNGCWIGPDLKRHP